MLTIIVAVVLFVLAWLFIQMVPLPKTMPPATRTVGFCVLILVASWWVWTRFMR